MTRSRPRLLFLCQCLPYPAHTGVTNRTLHILEELQREFDVTLVPFFRRQHQADAAAVLASEKALAERLTAVRRPSGIPNEHSRVRLVWDHLRSVVTGRAYVFYEYRSGAFRKELRAALKAGTPNLVHLDSLDLYGWLDELPDCPTVCTHHNMESELLELRARHSRHWIVRRYIRYQAQLVQRLERAYANRFALNLMVSELDATRLQELAPGVRTAVIPNGVDIEYFQPRPDSLVPGRLVFLGPTYMYANWDAVNYFLSSIWPPLKTACPEATLHLIGRAGSSGFRHHPGVIGEGFLADMRSSLAEAACFIVPLRVGGGTRLKILDAWAMGKAVVSTSVGCEGLQAVDGENILIRDTPDAFADAIRQVLENDNLRQDLERNARRTAERTYAWSKVGTAIRESLKLLVPR